MPEAPRYRRALVVKLRHHGDVLLTTPVFATLAAAGIEADALVYDDTAAMLTFNPDVADIHCIGRRWRSLGATAKLARYHRLYRAIRARGYDLLVHLTDHWHGAWLARMLKPAASVAPDLRRSGSFGDRCWNASFTHRYPVLPGNRRHTVETHLDALRCLGMHPTSAQKATRFVAGADAEHRVTDELGRLGWARGTHIHVHPTSRWLFKSWSIAGMAELIDLLTARGERVVVTAAPAPAELEWVRQLTQRLSRPVTDLSGKLDLKQLGAWIGAARAFIGVDSVPMHLAAAQGIPSVALFGPSGDVEWGPWQVAHRIVTTPFSCRPCGQDGCGGSKVSDCLMAIEARDVLSALDELTAAGR